jgi:hypothetical protein
VNLASEAVEDFDAYFNAGGTYEAIDE